MFRRLGLLTRRGRGMDRFIRRQFFKQLLRSGGFKQIRIMEKKCP